MSDLFNQIVNTIQRETAEFQRHMSEARCPLAERIIARNLGSVPRHGMLGALDVFSHMISSSFAKRKAAEAIICLRRNRVALAKMGKNPHCTDEIFLLRAAAYRREAIRLKGMGL